MSEVANQWTIHVIVDTNVLNAGESLWFMSRECSELLKKPPCSPGTKISLHIPHMVSMEREAQMRKAALSQLRTARDFCRLMEHDISNLDSEAVQQTISKRVVAAIESHLIRVHELLPWGVDWAEMSRRAAFRQPPFSEGETEKGFKDAVIVETICQIVSGLGDLTRSSVFVVSNDNLLRSVLQVRLVAPQVNFLEDLGALKNMLQASATDLGPEQAQLLLVKASEAFFTPDSDDNFWTSASIYTQVMAKFPQILSPTGVFGPELLQHIVHFPGYLKEDEGRMEFITPYQIDVSAMVWVTTTDASQGNAAATGLPTATQAQAQPEIISMAPHPASFGLAPSAVVPPVPSGFLERRPYMSHVISIVWTGQWNGILNRFTDLRLEKMWLHQSFPLPT